MTRPVDALCDRMASDAIRYCRSLDRWINPDISSAPFHSAERMAEWIEDYRGRVIRLAQRIMEERSYGTGVPHPVHAPELEESIVLDDNE